MNSDYLTFIGCSPRSGSTMLIRILNSHSCIAAPCEIGVPEYFQSDRKRDIIEKRFKKICLYYKSEWHTSSKNPTILFKNILSREKKRNLIIKDPRHSLFFKNIIKDYRNSKFIHLVRNAKSVAMSKIFQQDPHKGLRRWYEYNRAIIDAFDILSNDKVYLVRYEDLVLHPQNTLKKLLRFIGFDYEEGIINYGAHNHADECMDLWEENKNNPHWLESVNMGTIIPTILHTRSIPTRSILYEYNNNIDIILLNNYFGYK